MKKTIFLAVLLAGVLVSASVAQPSEQGEATVFKYTATLLGANEIPTADPTAVGFAEVTADTTTNTVSWVILAPDLANVSASHIHRGGPTVASGTVVIPFNQPFTNGVSSGSATITPALMSELVGNPGGFYVNVHNTAFPGGAIRGQLMPAPLGSIGSCATDRNTLCLNQGRFKVQVAFQTATANGVGVAIPFTDDTGAFWFF
ncbi:MAG TPA: CHRD domain-containing protein, partial [Thermoanaerobaculia bacterium]|nr:CHRD domain-containing protein [Thermoanaerobaculia bacterium]